MANRPLLSQDTGFASSSNRFSWTSALYNGNSPVSCLPRTLMAATDLVLALTGASGAPYGVRLLEVLLGLGRTVHLTISPAAVEVMEQELDRKVRLAQFELRDLLGASADGLPGRVVY